MHALWQRTQMHSFGYPILKRPNVSVLSSTLWAAESSLLRITNPHNISFTVNRKTQHTHTNTKEGRTDDTLTTGDWKMGTWAK